MKPTSVPIPVYYFRVTIPDTAIISCAAVSGLDLEYNEISYRSGDTPIIIRMKAAGLRKSGDITLKCCRADNVQAIESWYEAMRCNNIQRREITVELIGECQDVVKRWRAINAWPKKIVVGDAASADFDFETVTLAHEGINED